MASDETSLREFNMSRRRARILDEARNLITRGGLDALSIRALARAADVTVPTVYNLVGNKEALVVSLFAGALTEVEMRVGSHRDAPPLEMTEAVVSESTGMFSEDEDYYRAAFLAVEYLDQSGAHHDTVAQLYQWGAGLIVAGCDACREAGLLRGQIPTRLIGAQILRSYRTSCRAWAFSMMSVEEFRRTALTDVYISLAADAVDTFHALLIRKIAALQTAAPSNTNRRVRRGKE